MRYALPPDNPDYRETAPPLAGTLIDGDIPEQDVIFDPADGHTHNGTDSRQVDHDDLANVSEDQHHTKQHNLWDSAHHGDVTGTPANGDLVYRNSSWQLLPKSTNGFFLWLASGLPAWIQLAFSHITGTISDAQHGALTTSSTHALGGDASGTTAAVTVNKIKGLTVATPAAGDDGQYLRYNHATGYTWETPADTTGSDGSDHNLFSHADTTGSPAEGDLIYRNASSQWTRRAIGSAGAFLRVVSGLPAWATAAFSDLTGAISDAQHGALSTSSSHSMAGDVSGTTAAAVVDKIKGLAVTAPAAGDDGQFLRYNHATGYTWETPTDSTGSNGSDHDLFSHADTTGTPATGDVIYRNGSSQWTKLAAGAAGTFLTMGATVPAWGNLSAIATGDVAYTANAGKVTAIQNVAIPAPTSAEDEKAVVYDHGTTAFVYRNRDCELSGGWSRNNLGTNAGAIMSRVGGGGNNLNAPWIPHRAGVITGLSVATDGDIGGVGDLYTIGLWINGSNTLAALVLTGTAGTDVSAYTTTGGGALPVTFAAGDQVELRDGETGTLAAVGAQAQIFGYFT